MGRDTITQETVETIKETGRRKIEKGRMRLVDGGGHRRFHHKRGSGGELSSSFVPFIDIVSLCRCEGEADKESKVWEGVFNLEYESIIPAFLYESRVCIEYESSSVIPPPPVRR
ncbi:hypothetical protein L2E82_02846 [Cichorium intybus]|uniref:Uncharacterized protein n=1 Tax=Cichorium intybus TaxID=13427 RepID=A0ACB9H2R1_CICIN|nr:hypothetical protein L2E82_02846 [Cichorium intybus]